MSTTAPAAVTESRTSSEEVAALAREKRSPKYYVGMIASYIGMALIVLYCIIPFYWMVVSSLRLPTEGRSTEFVPSPVSVANYQGVFAGTNNFGRSLINSLIVSGTTTILTLLFGIVAAYALARLSFRGKGMVLWLIMACSMFPLIILIPPLLKMFSSTEPFTWFPYWINTYQAVIVPGLSFGLPLAVWYAAGAPWTIDWPALRGFNFRGGVTVSPEYFALLLGLVLYTAGFIAEIVRAGILAVPQGQWEAAQALGLRPGQVLKRIVLPQALRVIVPPMTSQYLNITKNSSLAVAIGYQDIVSIANTTLNQTGQAIEGIAIIMLVYLTISLSISLFMNWYNARIALVER